MRIRYYISALLLPLLLSLPACSDDPLPTGSGHDDEDATEDLNVDLSVSPDHVHILSEVTFTATVTDHHGEAVTDFDSLRVEWLATGETSWSSEDLSLQNDSYVGTHTFASSGDYEVRVVGKRPHDASAVTMYEMPDHLHAARAHHADAGGYTVEFEAFPGHVHEGQAATLRFWVTDADAPVTGLSPEIHVTEEGGSEMSHSASETESGSGVYEAAHTFGSAGDATVGLHFTGSGGSSAEAEFTMEVAHAH